MLSRIRPAVALTSIGWMAERSKALVSGTSLFGGEGSNPSSVTTFLAPADFYKLGGKNKRQAVISAMELSRLAQLVERKTLNLVVVGSSPTVGIPFFFLPQLLGGGHCQSGAVDRVIAPVAQLAARRSHNPKVASSILAGSSYFFYFYLIFLFLWFCVCPVGGSIGWMAERSKALV